MKESSEETMDKTCGDQKGEHEEVIEEGQRGDK